MDRRYLAAHCVLGAALWFVSFELFGVAATLAVMSLAVCLFGLAWFAVLIWRARYQDRWHRSYSVVRELRGKL